MSSMMNLTKKHPIDFLFLLVLRIHFSIGRLGPSIIRPEFPWISCFRLFKEINLCVDATYNLQPSKK